MKKCPVPAAILLSAAVLLGRPLQAAERHPLDPHGKVHIPIGLANTVDALKTFVEAEGNFSPGAGSYGIYFWVWDAGAAKLRAPTLDGAGCEHGLAEGRWLIPWSRWKAGDVEVKTEVCQVTCPTPAGDLFLTAARVSLENRGSAPAKLQLLTAIRPLGAAGGPVKKLEAAPSLDALLAGGRAALVSTERASAAGVDPADVVGDLALQGSLPEAVSAESPDGNCSGALRHDLEIPPGKTRALGFICPVHPGRRAAGHLWDGVSAWAQFDLNPPVLESGPDSGKGGILQPDPGLESFREIARRGVDPLFAQALEYWKGLSGKVKLELPDPRWAECFAAIVGHSALCMNEGAPDVAVVNYNVFNRDGMYMASIFQKSGNLGLAEAALDYFLGHPFNGRVQPEADNPGQILWILCEHWKFGRDRKWLERVYPSVRKIAAMIRYYRTAPEPHWVWDTSLEFGDALPADRRKLLRPGACDGHNPAYTEAYDIAGLRAAAALAEAAGMAGDARDWHRLAEDLFEKYEGRFGANLPAGYGSYCVLWPCRLYPLEEGKAREQFRGLGAQRPESWRYFPLARAHQGLLAGSRAAGWGTLAVHLDHPQMKGWYAFDEGGDSGAGGWNHVRTRWRQGKASDAMPHGWAIAEVLLLLRDCLLFEDGERLVLLGGVPPEWFQGTTGMKVEDLPTHFGTCSFEYRPRPGGASLAISGTARPGGGFALRLPAELEATVLAGGEEVSRGKRGDFLLPPAIREASIRFSSPAGKR